MLVGQRRREEIAEVRDDDEDDDWDDQREENAARWPRARLVRLDLLTILGRLITRQARESGIPARSSSSRGRSTYPRSIRRYRFVLRPKWLLSHLFALSLIVGFISLGFWQLRRLDERRERNELIEARADRAPVDVVDLVDDRPGDVHYRAVTVHGRSIADATVLIDNRSSGGQPGAWVLTPVNVDGDREVLVNRGFAPYGEQNAVAVPPWSDEVTVAGIVELEATRACPGGPVENDRPRYPCIDISSISDDVAVRLAPFVVRLEKTDDDLLPAPAPELGEGPHRSYAVQWFIFTAIGIVGYALILRKNAIRIENEERASEADREAVAERT